MQSIAKDIYIEDQYPGVTLGAINFPHGLIQIDAPPSPEDGRAWRAALLNLGGGAERLLVNLDAHPDRTLGARAMDCTVVAHEKTAQVFRSRPNTFKAQGDETGADWESIPGLGNIRWAPPEITFSHQMTIHWGESAVCSSTIPAPAGATWVILPGAKVVFVGDAVLKNQPPFLAGADLPAWLETLKLLLSPVPELAGGQRARRGGCRRYHPGPEGISRYNVQDKIEKLAQKKASPEAVENLISPVVEPVQDSRQPAAEVHPPPALWVAPLLRPPLPSRGSGSPEEEETRMAGAYTPIFEVTRGRIVESVHFGAAAVVDSIGRLLAWHGDPQPGHLPALQRQAFPGAAVHRARRRPGLSPDLQGNRLDLRLP